MTISEMQVCMWKQVVRLEHLETNFQEEKSSTTGVKYAAVLSAEIIRELREDHAEAQVHSSDDSLHF